MKRLLFLLRIMAIGLFFTASGQASAAASCNWQGASVFEGQWLECPTCVYQYCQCQPNGSWGNCGHQAPSQSCDWSNPDWSSDACSTGGFKPCDWANPDPANPSCNTDHSGGSTTPTAPTLTAKCLKCHPSIVPTPIPNPGNNPAKIYELGKVMYQRTCETCHNPLSNSTKKGRQAQQILDARAFHIALEPTNNTWADGWKANSLEMVLSGNPPPSGGETPPPNWTSQPPNWTEPAPNWTGGVTSFPETGVAYQIQALHSGKCLDLRDHNTENGTVYQQWKCTGEPHQRFYFTKNSDGTYLIRNELANRCISIVWGYTNDGAQLHSWDCTGEPDQHIALEANDFGGAYSLKFKHSGRCADVQDASSNDGKNVHQWQCYPGSKNQAWKIVR